LEHSLVPILEPILEPSLVPSFGSGSLKETRVVSHCDLAIHINTYLKANLEELWGNSNILNHATI
jgi:hypothetical protein